MNLFNDLYHRLLWQRRQKTHRLAQGRLTAVEVLATLSTEGHLPLAVLPSTKYGAAVNVPAGADGHILLVAPPDSGRRDQLAEMLVHWPAAALVIDPDGYLYQKTGHLRDTRWGKVYALPGYRFNLTRYYRFWDGAVAQRLHRFLFRPQNSEEALLLAHTEPLLQALGQYSYYHQRNPLQVLLDAAATDLLRVLLTLETLSQARHQVRRFTKGQGFRQALTDPTVQHSFALFSRYLTPYQRLYHFFTLADNHQDREQAVPYVWPKLNSTLYVTYPIPELAELAGLIAAYVDGLCRYHQAHGHYEDLLLVFDAGFARYLPPIEQVLADAAAYGITIVLTAESISALNELAADGDGAALAGRFAHQVWYPPHDRQTAHHMSWLYGTQLKATDPFPDGAQSSYLLNEPVLSPQELLAWPHERVLVYTRRDRPYRFLAEQVPFSPDPAPRPPPKAPDFVPPPRDTNVWLPSYLDHIAFLIGPALEDEHTELPDKLVAITTEAELLQAGQTIPARPQTDCGAQLELPFVSPEGKQPETPLNNPERPVEKPKLPLEKLLR